MIRPYIERLFIICLFVLTSCTYFDDDSLTYSSDEERWLFELSSSKYKGRKTGTDGNKCAYNYLVKELKAIGHDIYIDSLSFRDSIMMRNIVTVVPGQTDSVIILGAHYDGAVSSLEYDAANDNLSGVITILSIAKKIRSSNETILLCLWDGEEQTSGSVFNGSRHFVSNYENINKVKWYCNFDTCGCKDEIVYLYYSEPLVNSFTDIYSYIINAYPLLLMQHEIQGYSRSDYVSFREVGIPIWGWSDKDYKLLHTSKDSRDIISIQKIKDVSSASLEIIELL